MGSVSQLRNSRGDGHAAPRKFKIRKVVSGAWMGTAGEGEGEGRVCNRTRSARKGQRARLGRREVPSRRLSFPLMMENLTLFSELAGRMWLRAWQRISSWAPGGGRGRGRRGGRSQAGAQNLVKGRKTAEGHRTWCRRICTISGCSSCALRCSAGCKVRRSRVQAQGPGLACLNAVGAAGTGSAGQGEPTIAPRAARRRPGTPPPA